MGVIGTMMRLGLMVEILEANHIKEFCLHVYKVPISSSVIVIGYI